MIKRELGIFLIVGLLTVLVDFLSYHALMVFGLVDTNTAKAAGFLIGTLFAYGANRFWTFSHKPHAPGSVGRFAALYASTLGVNVFVNAFVLHLFIHSIAAVHVAFVIATGVSACLNFLGMKFFVFRVRLAAERP